MWFNISMMSFATKSSFTMSEGDLGTIFGMRKSVLSEEIREALRHFIGSWGHILSTFRADLPMGRKERYDVSLRDQGPVLPKCVAFIDFTAR